MNKQSLLAETLYVALAEHQSAHTGDFQSMSTKDMVEAFKVASMLFCMDQSNNDPTKADKMWGLKPTYIRDRKKTAEEWGIDAVDRVDKPEGQLKASAALAEPDPKLEAKPEVRASAKSERRGHRNELTIPAQSSHEFEWPSKVEEYWRDLDREELEGMDLEDQLEVLFSKPSKVYVAVDPAKPDTKPSKMIELVEKDQASLPMGAPDLGEDMPPKMPEIVKATAKYQNNLKDKIT